MYPNRLQWQFLHTILVAVKEKDSSFRSFGRTLIALDLEQHHGKEGNKYRVIVLDRLKFN